MGRGDGPIRGQTTICAVFLWISRSRFWAGCPLRSISQRASSFWRHPTFSATFLPMWICRFLGRRALSFSCSRRRGRARASNRVIPYTMRTARLTRSRSQGESIFGIGRMGITRRRFPLKRILRRARRGRDLVRSFPRFLCTTWPGRIRIPIWRSRGLRSTA